MPILAIQNFHICHPDFAKSKLQLFIFKVNNPFDHSENDIFEEYLGLKSKTLLLPEYFENYRDYLKKNTFNSLLKGVIKPNF